MNVLIVGQGIAGTVLASVLHQEGCRVTVADKALPGRSSVVAAGIVNPVTGKRFVKSWRFDEFYPAARDGYLRLQAELDVPVWEPYPIVRMLASAGEANSWSARCAQDDYAPLVSELPDAADWQGLVRGSGCFGLIEQAARVNFQQLLSAFRKKWQQSGNLMEREIRYDEAPELLKKFDAVVFCEGFRAPGNPFFPELPWRLAKGEALIVRLKSPQAKAIRKMLKKQIILAPLGDGLFWAGGSYQWHYPDLMPSREEGALLAAHLKDMLEAPFEIVNHLAAVRPAVVHRRPLMGKSRLHDRVFLFNGLGTKGALLAPFMATHFAGYLLRGEALDPEVEIYPDLKA